MRLTRCVVRPYSPEREWMSIDVIPIDDRQTGLEVCVLRSTRDERIVISWSLGIDECDLDRAELLAELLTAGATLGRIWRATAGAPPEGVVAAYERVVTKNTPKEEPT